MVARPAIPARRLRQEAHCELQNALRLDSKVLSQKKGREGGKEEKEKKASLLAFSIQERV